MSNEFVIKDDVYSVLVEYFDGDIINLDKKILSGLKKGKFKKKEVEPIDGNVYKTLRKILKFEEDNPEGYAEIEWIYPEKVEEVQEEEEVKEEVEDITPKEDESEEVKKDPYKSIEYGILKHSVPDFIKKEGDLMKLINKIEDANIEDGGSGAFYVYLKKKI